MNSLAARKQLLIAESDLNRAQMIQEGRVMKAEMHSLTYRAKNITVFVSIAASLVAAISAFRRQPSAPTGKKSSWWQTLVTGAGLVSSFWSEFRPRRHDHDKE